MEKLNAKLTVTMILSLAARLLMEDSESELRAGDISPEWRRETRFGLGEINKNLDKALVSVRKAKAAYDRFIDSSIIATLKDSKTDKFNVKKHDEVMKDANETIRLHMLHYDRSYLNPENTVKIFGFLESLEGQGIFTKEDIEQYKM